MEIRDNTTIRVSSLPSSEYLELHREGETTDIITYTKLKMHFRGAVGSCHAGTGLTIWLLLKVFDGKLDSTWPEFMESLAVSIKFIIPSLYTSFPQQVALVGATSSMMDALKKQESSKRSKQRPSVFQLPLWECEKIGALAKT